MKYLSLLLIVVTIFFAGCFSPSNIDYQDTECDENNFCIDGFTCVDGGCVANTIATKGQWEIASLGGGGWFRSIKLDPQNSDIIYMTGDLSGFTVSKDRGETWTMSNDGLDNYDGSSLAITSDGSALFLGTDGGIYKSTNKGQSWQRKGSNQIYPEIKYVYDASSYGDQGSFSISAIYVHPANDNIIFAGTGFTHNVKFDSPIPSRIYRSKDGGETWEDVSIGIAEENNPFSAFASHPDAPNIIFASAKKALYKSTNGGDSWSIVSNPANSGIRWVQINPANKNEIWISKIYTDSGLWKSTNGGSSWVQVGKNIPLVGINNNLEPEIEEIHFSKDGSRIYVGSTKGNPTFLYSDDGGQTWNEYPIFEDDWHDKEGQTISTTSFDVSEDGNVLVVCGGNVYVSYNAGQTFEYKHTKQLPDGTWTSRGPEINGVFSMSSHPTNPNRIYRLTGDTGLQISDNKGYSWKWVRDPSDYMRSSWTMVFDVDNSEIIYMMQGGNDDKGLNEPFLLLKSTDGGESWSLMQENLPDAKYKHITMNSEGTLFVSTYKSLNDSDARGIYKSTDRGRTWTQIHAESYSYRMLAIAPSNEDIMYAATKKTSWDSGYALYKTENGGNTWIGLPDKNPNFPEKVVHDYVKNVKWVAVHPNNPDIILVAEIGSTETKLGGIWRSENGGHTFERVVFPANDGSPGIFSMVKFDPTNSNRVYATASSLQVRADKNVGEGIFRSEDGGKTWESINFNLPFTTINGVEISPHTGDVFVFTAGGGSYVLRNK